MTYLFMNIETEECFYCEESLWKSTLEIAKSEGWEPDGTYYDINSQYEDGDFDDDFNRALFCYCVHTAEMHAWDGNFIERRDQIVSYVDSMYLVKALEGMGVDASLVAFLDKGSFRICSI